MKPACAQNTHIIQQKKNTGVQVSNLLCTLRVKPHVFDKSSSRARWGNDEVISVLWTGSHSLGRVHFKLLLSHTHTLVVFGTVEKKGSHTEGDKP